MERHRSRAELLLIEVLVVILFFSIAATVCLRMFSAASVQSQDSAALGSAVLVAQTAAESWKYTDGDPDETAALLHGVAQNQGLFLYYDTDWQDCSAADAAFCLTLQWDEAVAQIFVTKADGSPVYDLSVQSIGGAR